MRWEYYIRLYAQMTELHSILRTHQIYYIHIYVVSTIGPSVGRSFGRLVGSSGWLVGWPVVPIRNPLMWESVFVVRTRQAIQFIRFHWQCTETLLTLPLRTGSDEKYVYMWMRAPSRECDPHWHSIHSEWNDQVPIYVMSRVHAVPVSTKHAVSCHLLMENHSTHG